MIKNGSEICLILNKRSLKVKQPGDLCFPGGGIMPGIDSFLARLMVLPLFPLRKWTFWPLWRNQRPEEAKWISLLLSTGLRESFEEMRLNPFGVKFLGPLPSHRLRMFRRKIYPMVGWVSHQNCFLPNWEVEKVVKIPIRLLLNRNRYARYRVSYSHRLGEYLNRPTEDFPCFEFKDGDEKEHLWGVTYSIVMSFMKIVFQFQPPESSDLPVVVKTLESNYLTGS
jgi:8-oxo-dGTP pyrophosphatase MutT (NUDIX family)